MEATGLTQQPDLTEIGKVDGRGAGDGRDRDRAAVVGGGVAATRRCSSASGCPPATEVTGPAIIAEANATTVVDDGLAGDDDGRRATCWSSGCRPRAGAGVGTAADPVMLEIFNNLFMSIAEQMGAALESTAQSVNIRERLDFSCALFDPAGNLIANAPHIPVHLGSMGTSVKEVVRRRRGVTSSRATCTRSTTRTTAAPICPTSPSSPPCSAPARRPSRSCSSWPPAVTTPRSAGSRPARCPPNSRDVHEEGVLFDNWLLVSDGRFREEETRRLLTEARYPSRDAGHQPRRPAGAGRGERQGGRGARQDDRALRARRGPRLHGPRPGQRRGVGAPGHRRPRRRRLPLRDRLRCGDRGAGHGRPGATIGDDRLHRHVTAAGDELQRPVFGGDGGRAVRVPDARRDRHPAQRRLHAAAAARDPRRFDARPRVPGGRRRGQRRDLPGDHRGACTPRSASRRRDRGR